MFRFLAAAAVSALVVASPAGGATPYPGDIVIAAQFATAQVAADQGQYARVMRSLKMAMQDDVYAQLSPGRAYEVAELYATAAYAQERWPEAHRGYVRAAASPQATDDDWGGRLQTAVESADAGDAWVTFTRQTGRRLPTLEDFGGRGLNRLDRLFGTLPNATEARLALGRELEREEWTPTWAMFDPSFVWLHYALALVETNQPAKAAAAAAHITDPTALMAMRADRRFDALFAGHAEALDPTRAAAHYVEAAQAYAKENPRLLDARITLGRALLVANRPADAAAVLDDSARALAKKGPNGTDPFDDMSNVYVLHVMRSTALIEAGRVEDGLASRSAATTCGCSAYQVVQLAQSLLEAGRAVEAVRWLDGLPLEEFGPETRVGYVRTRACVAAEVGDAAHVEESLAYLKAHEGWDPQAYVGALVCADRSDEAAETIMRQLRDPGLRLDALTMLQGHAAPLGAQRPYPEKIAARWATIKARPEVRQAVIPFGRIENYALRTTDLLL